MQPAAQIARRASRTCCISLLLTAVTAVLAGLAQAAQVPAADPAQGDGGISPFYTWGEDIPVSPGQLLRSETLAPTLMPDRREAQNALRRVNRPLQAKSAYRPSVTGDTKAG